MIIKSYCRANRFNQFEYYREQQHCSTGTIIEELGVCTPATIRTYAQRYAHSSSIHRTHNPFLVTPDNSSAAASSANQEVSGLSAFGRNQSSHATRGTGLLARRQREAGVSTHVTLGRSESNALLVLLQSVRYLDAIV